MSHSTNPKGPVPFEVNFIDKSIPGSSSVTWSWDFGDGKTSTDQNPVHTYKDAGIFTVKLTVTSADGSNTMERRNYITALKAEPAPVVPLKPKKPELGATIPPEEKEVIEVPEVIDSSLPVAAFSQGACVSVEKEPTYCLPCPFPLTMGCDVSIVTFVSQSTAPASDPINRYEWAVCRSETSDDIRYDPEQEFWLGCDNFITTANRHQLPAPGLCHYNQPITLPSFCQVFEQMGEYSVALRVTNSAGSDTIVKKNIIKITPDPSIPYPDFELDVGAMRQLAQPEKGPVKYFKDTSYKGDGTYEILERTWIFFDGEIWDAMEDPYFSYQTGGPAGRLGIKDQWRITGGLHKSFVTSAGFIVPETILKQYYTCLSPESPDYGTDNCKPNNQSWPVRLCMKYKDADGQVYINCTTKRGLAIVDTGAKQAALAHSTKTYNTRIYQVPEYSPKYSGNPKVFYNIPVPTPDPTKPKKSITTPIEVKEPDPVKRNYSLPKMAKCDTDNEGRMLCLQVSDRWIGGLYGEGSDVKTPLFQPEAEYDSLTDLQKLEYNYRSQEGTLAEATFANPHSRMVPGREIGSGIMNWHDFCQKWAPIGSMNFPNSLWDDATLIPASRAALAGGATALGYSPGKHGNTIGGQCAPYAAKSQKVIQGIAIPPGWQMVVYWAQNYVYGDRLGVVGADRHLNNGWGRTVAAWFDGPCIINSSYLDEPPISYNMGDTRRRNDIGAIKNSLESAKDLNPYFKSYTIYTNDAGLSQQRQGPDDKVIYNVFCPDTANAGCGGLEPGLNYHSRWVGKELTAQGTYSDYSKHWGAAYGLTQCGDCSYRADPWYAEKYFAGKKNFCGQPWDEWIEAHKKDGTWVDKLGHWKQQGCMRWWGQDQFMFSPNWFQVEAAKWAYAFPNGWGGYLKDKRGRVECGASIKFNKIKMPPISSSYLKNTPPPPNPQNTAP